MFDQFTSCDERAVIDEVVRHCNLDQTWLAADDCLTFRNFHAWPLARDLFSQNTYVALPIRVAQAAQDAGCRVLLGGYYGDALFMTPTYVLADRLYQGRLLDAAKWLTAHWDLYRHWVSLVDAVLRPLLSPTLKRIYRRLRRRPFQAPIDGIAPTRLHALATAREKAPLSDEPPGLLPTQRRLRNFVLHSIWGADSASARGMTANRFGLERAAPYFDRRIVEFVLAVPAEHLNCPSWDRGLQRNAMRQLLPEPIAQQQKTQDYRPVLAAGLAESLPALRTWLGDHPLILTQRWAEPNWLRDSLRMGHTAPDGGYALSVFLHLERWLRSLDQ